MSAQMRVERSSEVSGSERERVEEVATHRVGHDVAEGAAADVGSAQHVRVGHGHEGQLALRDLDDECGGGVPPPVAKGTDREQVP